ncbi:MAG TPA: hypothetical protein VIH46_08545 [Candidatus Acidoferrales bacterium]
MVRIVWEFTARADKIQEFEKFYADSGPWTQLFARIRAITVLFCCAISSSRAAT